MINSLVEFAEATAFERSALEGLVPMVVTHPHAAVRDLQSNAVSNFVGAAIVHIYGCGVAEVYVELRPLAFGAAWKVLDLLVELSLSQAGIATSGRMSIEAKIKRVGGGAGTCPPLSEDAALWRTLTGVYQATKETRHSLVHRRAHVDRASGLLVGSDAEGRPLTPLTAEHQEAFCRVVQRAAGAAIAGGLTPRERSDLDWNLDCLASIHGQSPLGGHRMEAPALVIAPVRLHGGSALVNASELLSALRQNFSGRRAFDATFALPDRRHLLVELEQAPPDEVSVDLVRLPAWAQFWGRTPPKLSALT